MKKLALILSVTFLGFGVVQSYAQESSIDSNENNINEYYENIETLNLLASDEIQPRSINPVRYRKENVRVTEEWSSALRISDYITTGRAGGSITSTYSKTISGSVSGNIYGISVQFGGSVSASKGYTLQVGPNQRKCLGYRAKYRVERGTRVTYDAQSGKVLSRNSYVAKKTLYGNYFLMN